MGKPAARLGDMHTCPMVNPGPVPHVGGPITGPGCPTVLIGGVPAAVMGDICVCVGPPDTIVMGSTGVLIGGKPAARLGDNCAHGGVIVVGCPTVLIGESRGGGGMPASAQLQQNIALLPSDARGSLSRAERFREAARNADPFVRKCKYCGK